jgi:hypothetical protein
MMGPNGARDFLTGINGLSGQEMQDTLLKDVVGEDRAQLYTKDIVGGVTKKSYSNDELNKIAQQMTVADYLKTLMAFAIKGQMQLPKMPELGPSELPVETPSLDIEPTPKTETDTVFVEQNTIGFGVKAESDVDAIRTNSTIVREAPQAGITFDPQESYKIRSGLYGWGKLFSPEIDEDGMQKAGPSAMISAGAGLGYYWGDQLNESVWRPENDFEPVEEGGNFTPVGEEKPSDKCCEGPEARKVFVPDGYEGLLGYGEIEFTGSYTLPNHWSILGSAGYLVEGPIPSPGTNDRGQQAAFPGGANHQITIGGGIERQFKPGFAVRARYEHERDNIGYRENTISLSFPVNDQIGENRPIPYKIDRIHNKVKLEVEAGRFEVGAGAEIIRGDIYPDFGLRVDLITLNKDERKQVSQPTVTVQPPTSDANQRDNGRQVRLYADPESSGQENTFDEGVDPDDGLTPGQRAFINLGQSSANQQNSSGPNTMDIDAPDSLDQPVDNANSQTVSTDSLTSHANPAFDYDAEMDTCSFETSVGTICLDLQKFRQEQNTDITLITSDGVEEFTSIEELYDRNRDVFNALNEAIAETNQGYQAQQYAMAA